MSAFIDTAIEQMKQNGYVAETVSRSLARDVIGFKHSNGQMALVVYLKKIETLDGLKAYFEVYKAPILFVVDSQIVEDEGLNSKWLRAIHALYFGRIYTWQTSYIAALHYDRLSGQYTKWSTLDFAKLKFESVDCWYKEFPGVYSVFHFNEGAFWKPQEPKRERKAKQPNENEQFWRKEYERQQRRSTEDVYEAFREAFNAYKRMYENQNSGYDTAWAKQKPSGDQWFEMMYNGGSLAEAKRIYRQLGLQYHPDVNKSPEATEIMIAINNAYERVKGYLR